MKVDLHQRLSSTKGRLPPKVIFHRRSSSTEGCPPLKVVFHKRSPSPKDCFPPKVVFHRRSSSTEGRLPSKVVFHCSLKTKNTNLDKTNEKNEKKTPKKPYFEAACCLKNVSKSANSWPAVDLLALIGVWMGYDHSERLMLQMLQFNGYNVEKGQWTTAILHNTMTGTSLATRPHTTSPLYYLGI